MKKVEYIEMDYREFEKLVKETYGQEYEFVADIECGNDSEHTYNIDGTIPSYEEGCLTRFKETGEGCYLSRILLSDLVGIGKLPKSDYLITVCW